MRSAAQKPAGPAPIMAIWRGGVGGIEMEDDFGVGEEENEREEREDGHMVYRRRCCCWWMKTEWRGENWVQHRLYVCD
jgi:hypothetical protein